jgi:hypothetical protein
MGLELELETITGATGNYHRIDHVNIDIRNRKSFLSVVTYKDLEASRSGKAPLQTRAIEMELAPEHAGMIYGILKEWPMFVDAVDVDPDELTEEPEEVTMEPGGNDETD